jgi:flagellar assembly protein FliH
VSTVIKSTDRNAGIYGPVFNFEDLSHQANEYLASVRVGAAKIVAAAEHEADSIRRRAAADGRAAADNVIDQKIEKRLQTAFPAIAQVVGRIAAARQEWLAEWEKQAVHLAAAMAARVIRREIKNQPEVTVALIREALDLAAGAAKMRVLLNPADHTALSGHINLLVDEFSRLAPTEFVADERVTPGGCRVETTFGTIDQTFEAQLARIEEELT